MGIMFLSMAGCRGVTHCFLYEICNLTGDSGCIKKNPEQ